eukprot:TRINITY_DN7404_c0_g1_i1.p1 TRINITY_DN7404_c0_g1~~TRINITY_DN7404_c0_g1_i1.p1  ORF type:complete len:491 (-),score=116.16 TRINITY_DN7404_c0_g1_i1:110-1582(-)
MATTGIPIKIGFSLGKKTEKRSLINPAAAQVESREYVTGISDKQVESSAPKIEEQPLVIPPPQRARVQPVSSDVSSAPIDNSVSEPVPMEMDLENVPLLMRNQLPGISGIADVDERFKFDVENRPDVASLEAYEAIPVDKFGEALLRGMGWTPGSVVGTSSTTVTAPIEFISRPERLGLGAAPRPEPPPDQKKYIKPGDTRTPKEHLVLYDEQGHRKHIRTLDEKLVKEKPTTVVKDAAVVIVHGRHQGLEGRVVSKTNFGVQVRLKLNGETVIVAETDLRVGGLEMLNLKVDAPSTDSVGNAQYGLIKKGVAVNPQPPPGAQPTVVVATPATAAAAPDPIPQMQQYASTTSSATPSAITTTKSTSAAAAAPVTPAPKGWLCPAIRVRVIGKKFENGKYYNKKGIVLDVPGAGLCTLNIDGKIVDEVPERVLETVMPSVGQQVKIVYGKHKNKLAELLGRDRDTCLVRFADDFGMETVSLDYASEFIASR